MLNICRPPLEDCLYRKKIAESRFKLLTCSEQKKATWMKNILQWFTRPGNLVAKDCGGIFSAVKSCMLLPNHKTFIEIEADSNYVTEAIAQLMFLYACQVLKKEWHIDREEQVRSSAEVYVKAVLDIKV